MLGSLTLILLCQLLGEIVAKVADVPVPGPVIGMVIMFCLLLFCPAKLPQDVEAVGGFLLRYLALLFVPAGVGVITHLDLLLKSWAPIVGVIVVGTLATVAATGMAMQFMTRRCRSIPGESRQ